MRHIDWVATGSMLAGTGAMGTLVVAIVAAVYAKAQVGAAKRQVDEAKKLREDQARPYIVVDVQTSPASRIHIDLLIRNVGATAARNVRLAFQPKLKSSMYPDLMEWAIFKEGVKTMPPGREIRALFDSGPMRLKKGLDQRYDVVVEYEDLDGRTQQPLEFVLDIAALYGIHRIGIKTEHDSAKALEGIHDMLRQSQEGSRMVVWTSSYDYDREWKRSVEAITGEPAALSDSLPHSALIHIGVNPFGRLLIRAVRRVWRYVRR